MTARELIVVLLEETDLDLEVEIRTSHDQRTFSSFSVSDNSEYDNDDELIPETKILLIV